MFNPPDADISTLYANHYTCKSFKNHICYPYAYYLVAVLKFILHFQYLFNTYCICTYSDLFTWDLAGLAQTLSGDISNSAPPGIRHTDTELDHSPAKPLRTHLSYSIVCELKLNE